MTTNLKVLEVVEAAVAVLNTAATAGKLSVVPRLIQGGDLLHYLENPDTLADLPAIFVRPVQVTPSPIDLTGDVWREVTLLRIVLVDAWEMGEDLWAVKLARGNEIGQVFVGAVGTAFDLGGAIPGYVVEHALLANVEPAPPEEEALSLTMTRRLWAVAVTVAVTGRSERAA